MSTHRPSERGFVPAARWPRVAGWLVDRGVQAAILVIVVNAFDAGWWWWLATIAAYEIVLVALFGRTPGKVLVGTRIVDEQSGGNPSWLACAKRWLSLGWILITLPALGVLAVLAGAGWSLVVFASMLGDPRRRGLHDRYAGTVVLSDRAVSPTAGAAPQ